MQLPFLSALRCNMSTSGGAADAGVWPKGRGGRGVGWTGSTRGNSLVLLCCWHKSGAVLDTLTTPVSQPLH